MIMRYVFLCLLALSSARHLGAQAAPGGAAADTAFSAREEEFGGDLPPVVSVGSDWQERFSSIDDRRDFRRLRGYLAEKQARLDEAVSLLDRYKSRVEQGELRAKERENTIKTLDALLEPGSGPTVQIDASFPTAYDRIMGTATPGEVPVEGARALLDTLRATGPRFKERLDEAEAQLALAKANVETLANDVREAETTIDAALAPEYRSQNFRIWVSAFFSGLIAIMIISFFATIYKKSGNDIGTLLLSDGGLQFITIFVLIIAIILFGILNILEGRELAAILSGIAGYILGRGSRMKNDGAGGDRQEERPAPGGEGAAAPQGPRVGKVFREPEPAGAAAAGEGPAEAPKPAGPGN